MKSLAIASLNKQAKHLLNELEKPKAELWKDWQPINLTPKARLQNSIAIYTLGSLTKGYISGMKEPYNSLDAVGQKRQRRLKDLEVAINEAINPIEHQIKQNPGAEDDIMEYLGIYCVTCDEVFGLEKDELDQVNDFIEQLKQKRIRVTKHSI